MIKILIYYPCSILFKYLSFSDRQHNFNHARISTEYYTEYENRWTFESCYFRVWSLKINIMKRFMISFQLWHISCSYSVLDLIHFNRKFCVDKKRRSTLKTCNYHIFQNHFKITNNHSSSTKLKWVPAVFFLNKYEA